MVDNNEIKNDKFLNEPQVRHCICKFMKNCVLDILSGYLVKGDQPPSIRKCEALMKVSKTSIERAPMKSCWDGAISRQSRRRFLWDVEPENVQPQAVLTAGGAAG